MVARPQSELTRGLVVLVDDAAARPRELDGATNNSGKHGLEIECGADSPADLPERRESLNRARQLGGPGLQFPEQAYVLDGDDGLVGERLDHFDLRPGERSNFPSPYAEHAERHTSAEHRNRENRSEPLKGLHDENAVFRITTDVFDVNHGAGENRATHATAPIRPQREDPLLHDRDVFGR